MRALSKGKFRGVVGNGIVIPWISENCVGHVDLTHVEQLAHGRFPYFE